MTPRGRIEIVPHAQAWAIGAAAEAARLAHLGPVEHIGSTAIPGLSAKPILDLMLGVPSVDDLDAIVDPVEALGYLHWQSWEAIVAGRRYFYRVRPAAEPTEGAPAHAAPTVHTHHLHIVPFEGSFWRVHILFRDRLRADPTLAAAYEALKRELAARFPDDREGYMEAKGMFIERVIGT